MALQLSAGSPEVTDWLKTRRTAINANRSNFAGQRKAYMANAKATGMSYKDRRAGMADLWAKQKAGTKAWQTTSKSSMKDLQSKGLWKPAIYGVSPTATINRTELLPGGGSGIPGSTYQQRFPNGPADYGAAPMSPATGGGPRVGGPRMGKRTPPNYRGRRPPGRPLL